MVDIDIELALGFRLCNFCNKYFYPNNEIQKYCSKKHRIEDSRKKRLNKKIKYCILCNEKTHTDNPHIQQKIDGGEITILLCSELCHKQITKYHLFLRLNRYKIIKL